MKLARIVVFAGLLLVAAIAAFLAVIGAAAVTVWPPLFLAAGWVVFALGVYGAARLSCPSSRRGRAAAMTLAVLSLAGGFLLLWPGPRRVPASLPGTRWIDLPTGSRLAFLELTGPAPRDATPIIFLHGGPGVADMRGDAPYLRRLADAGHDVFLYDQLGAGRSTRLDDPTGYTLAHAVADLDGFRQAIGAERINLLGYSWGATLVAAYLAAHPGNVAKVVFISPGPIIGGASDLGSLLDRPRYGPSDWAAVARAPAPRAADMGTGAGRSARGTRLCRRRRDGHEIPCRQPDCGIRPLLPPAGIRRRRRCRLLCVRYSPAPWRAARPPSSVARSRYPGVDHKRVLRLSELVERHRLPRHTPRRSDGVSAWCRPSSLRRAPRCVFRSCKGIPSRPAHPGTNRFCAATKLSRSAVKIGPVTTTPRGLAPFNKDKHS